MSRSFCPITACGRCRASISSTPSNLKMGNVDQSVHYTPGESDTRQFGGNSNWRGPIWFPMNFLIIESLQKFHHYYGDDFKVECPTGSGNLLTIEEVANELSHRLSRIFLEGRRRRASGAASPAASCRTIRTTRIASRSTNTSTATPAAAWAPRIKRGWTSLIAKLLMPRAHD